MMFNPQLADISIDGNYSILWIICVIVGVLGIIALVNYLRRH